LAGGFAPVAKSNAEHTHLFALHDDLGFSLWSAVAGSGCYLRGSCSCEQIRLAWSKMQLAVT
jgi:hypothetical protein